MIFKKIKEIRSKKGELHFVRYRIISTPWFNIYVHNILKPDSDTHLHDHPWSFFAIILMGGYSALRVDKRNSNNIKKSVEFMGPLSVSYIPARGVYHKIAQIDKPVWSLVFTGSRKHFWGYDVGNKFVDHKTYRNRKNNKNGRTQSTTQSRK